MVDSSIIPCVGAEGSDVAVEPIDAIESEDASADAIGSGEADGSGEPIGSGEADGSGDAIGSGEPDGSGDAIGSGEPDGSGEPIGSGDPDGSADPCISSVDASSPGVGCVPDGPPVIVLPSVLPLSTEGEDFISSVVDPSSSDGLTLLFISSVGPAVIEVASPSSVPVPDDEEDIVLPPVW